MQKHPLVFQLYESKANPGRGSNPVPTAKPQDSSRRHGSRWRCLPLPLARQRAMVGSQDTVGSADAEHGTIEMQGKRLAQRTQAGLEPT